MRISYWSSDVCSSDLLSKAIEAKLAGGFLLEPKVSVQVASFRPVYVLGEVNKPGEYPYTQGLTIRGAVAKADGFTYRANEKRVFLKRAGERSEEHTSELQSLMRISYAVFCLKKKNANTTNNHVLLTTIPVHST